MKQKAFLFLIFTLAGGFLAAAGSIVGGLVAHRSGFIPGALVIGGVGLYIMARKIRPENKGVAYGALVGLVLSLAVSPWTLDSPVYTFASACLIGLGAALGSWEKQSADGQA